MRNEGRQRGLVKSVEKFAKAAALAAGVTALAELREMNPAERIPAPILEQLNAYREQKTTLTDKEIQHELSRCSFLDAPAPVAHIMVPPNERGPLRPGGFVDRKVLSLRSALSPHQLLVMQLDFDSIAQHWRGALYVGELSTIFINQTPDVGTDTRTAAIEEYLYLDTIKNDRDAKIQTFMGTITSSPTQDEKRNRDLRETGELYESQMNASVKKLELLPYSVLKKFESAIIQQSNEYRHNKEIQRLNTEANLGHEAFHHFFSHQLGEEGYEGPSVSELLFLAFSQTQKRFGNREQDYFNYLHVQDIVKHSKEISGKDFPKDPQALRDLCNDLAKRFDIRKPKEGSTQLHIELFDFLNEYLARVYTGLHGYTSESMEAKFAKADEQFLISTQRDPINFKKWYHTPTDEERAAFAQMKWNGKSVL